MSNKHSVHEEGENSPTLQGGTPIEMWALQENAQN
jgi:hypothetical protein